MASAYKEPMGRLRDSRRDPWAALRADATLCGVVVLVGRAEHQAGALSSELRKRGAQVIEIPFIEIRRPRSYRPLDSALKHLQSYDWLILTSANGVEALWHRLKKLRLGKRDLQHLQVAAIGPATKKAIEERGLKVDVVPEEYVAEAVVKSLRSRAKGKRVLLARAKVARDVIPRELRKLGAHVDVVEAYETVIPRSSQASLRSVLRDETRRPDVITFTSSSTARNFLALLGAERGGERSRNALDEIKLASIGPVTSATLRELGLPVHLEAERYTMQGLVDAIADAYRSSKKTTS